MLIDRVMGSWFFPPRLGQSRFVYLCRDLWGRIPMIVPFSGYPDAGQRQRAADQRDSRGYLIEQ